VGWIGTGAALGATIFLACGALYALAHLRRVRAPEPTGSCPADHEDGLGGAGIARLLVAETIAAAWLAALALAPRRSPRGPHAGAAAAALVVGPPWLPSHCLANLVRRLHRAGMAVATARLPRTASRARLARVAAVGEGLLQRSDADRLDLILYASAARGAGAVAALWSPTCLRRVLLLGGCPEAIDLPGQTEVVTIYSPHDPWRPPGPSPGRHGGRIEVRGVGRLALLLTPSIADLVAEACIDPTDTRDGA
jgi:hypothetical protein